MTATTQPQRAADPASNAPAPLSLPAPRMSVAERLRVGLVLAVTLFVFLEGLRYAGHALWSAQWSTFPGTSLTWDGVVVHWRERHRREADAYVSEVDVYDANRRPTGWTRTRPPVLSTLVSSLWMGSPELNASPLVRGANLGPPWLPMSHYAVMERRDPRRTLGSVADRLGAAMYPQGVRWSHESGRLVVRNGGVLGSLGPDGWVAGETGLAGARFGDLVFVGSRAHGERRSRDGLPNRDVQVVLADGATREAFVIDIRGAEDETVAPGQPLRLPTFDVARIPLGGTGPIEAIGALGTAEAFALRVGPEIVVLGLGKDGEVAARIPWDPSESRAWTWDVPDAAIPREHRSHRPIFVASSVPPFRPIGAHLRFRIARNGETTFRDVAMQPVTVPEHAVAWLRRAIAIVRPPVLSAASSFAPVPASYEAMFSTWLTDPLLAGMSELGTLALCLALGAVCAARARAYMRVQRPASTTAWTATVFALGPIGLVGMRLLVPRRAVRPCACSASRAVSVATCPSCHAPWPAPARTGSEVWG